jgi:hypothetical protein
MSSDPSSAGEYCSREEYARRFGLKLATVDRYRRKGFLKVQQAAKRHKVRILSEPPRSNSMLSSQEQSNVQDAKVKKSSARSQSGRRPKWMNEP